jgi:hypothetical protein
LTLLLATVLLSAVNIRPAETAFHEPGLDHAQQQLKLSGLESSEPPEIEWNQTYGGAGDECARSVVQTAEGGYALAGHTNSYGAGSYDFWLVKTDANGNVEWNRTYEGAGDELAWPLVQTADGGYALAGRTIKSYDPYDSDFWLVKTDSEGNMQWNKTYGGAGEDDAYSLIQTHDGGYALAGSTTVFDPEHGDAWLIKIKRARIPGDINADGTVNVFDAVILSGAAGSKPGDSNWNPNADINDDQIVDLFDAVILAGHAGEHYP